MNAKTTKFLAVLAVLAMAFAAVAVFAPAESDAAVVDSEWTISDTAKTTLTLGTDVIIPTDGQTIDAAKVYYVNADMTLVLSEEADMAVGATLIFLKAGVQLDTEVPEEHEKTIAYAILGATESTNKDGKTVLTMDGNFKNTLVMNWVKEVSTGVYKGFNTLTVWPGITGTDQKDWIVGEQALAMEKADKGGHFSFKCDSQFTSVNNGVYICNADVDYALYGDSALLFGDFKYSYQYTQPDSTDGSIWQLKEADGLIGSYGQTNKLDLDEFYGVITMKSDGSIEISEWVSGDITVTKGTVVVGATMPAGSSITFVNGITVDTGWTVSYERFVVDKYTFTMKTGAVKAGSDGLTITAGNNGLELSGNAIVPTEASEWEFKGAAKISGILNMNDLGFTVTGDKYQVTLENFRADNANKGLTLAAETVFESQVTVSGNVTAKGSMIVAPYAFVNITGTYTFTDPTTSSKALYTYVGKDATLRMAKAIGANSAEYTADDTEWSTCAFVDKTGKIFLNQNLVTKASGAVVSYLYQIGEGQVSVNSSLCSTYSNYYLYKQVIPYLLLNPVDVVCTSMIADKAEIDLTKVEYTETPVPTGNQARYNIDYETGVPVFLVFFKELYPVEIIEAYDAAGNQKIEVIDEDGNKVFMEPKMDGQTATTTGIVRLAYTYDYIIKGVDEKNKYTFYRDVQPGDDGAAAKKLEQINLYSSAFTMVRGYLTYNSGAPGTAHYITYEEGLAVELTVILEDANEQYSVGDVFMYFTTEVDEKGKPTGNGTPVVLESIRVGSQNYYGAVITEGLYSTDTVYFKSEYRLFYKLIGKTVGSEGIEFPTKDSVSVDVDFLPNTWSEGLKFTSATITEATLAVKCDFNKVKVNFVLDGTLGTNKYVYFEFTTYCGEPLIHKAKEKLSASTTAESPFYVVVGEVYNVTWDPMDGYFMDMTSKKTNVSTDVPKVYTMGTDVTVDTVELTYTLKITPIYYMTVINDTDYDLTVSIGKFRADVGADDKNEKVIINDGVGNAIILSKKGYTVDNWTFELKQSPVHHEYVSGTMTTKALITKAQTQTTPTIEGYYSTFPSTSEEQATFVLTITNAHVTPITYTVDVEADDHATITNYDNSGQLGQLRKAYVQPWQEYDVIAVEYEYQEIDMAQKAVGQAEKKISPETGQEYWEYVMPASNVLLKPIVQKETRNLSFVDETGATIAETQKVEPRTTVNEPVPCKPLYRIVEVTTEPTVEGFKYDPATGYMTFTMPDADVKVIVTCEEIQYSEKLLVTVGQEKNGADINVVLYALDGKAVGPGEVTIEVWYTYINEFGDVSVDYVDVTLTYEANDQTVAVLTDDTFIEELAENYNGAYAITGSYTFGTVEGELSTTEYKPVEA